MTALYIVFGFIYTLISIPMLVFGSAQLKIMGIIYLFMPVLLGVFGFLFFVVFAAVYNFLAKRLGGIEVEVASPGEGA